MKNIIELYTVICSHLPFIHCRSTEQVHNFHQMKLDRSFEPVGRFR